MFKRLHKFLSSPAVLRSVHGWLTVLWFVISIPAIMYWKESVPFLVFVSVYANFVGHFSSWQATRIEVEMEATKELNEQLPQDDDQNDEQDSTE